MIMLAPIALIIVPSWWMLGAIAFALAALFVAHEWTLHRAPLVATTETQAVVSRKWGNGFAAIVLIAGSVYAFFRWYQQ